MRKILVIEDETSIREEILEILEFEGFETIGAENGLRGLEVLERHIPDLILCDIMMPEMDGYDILLNVRNNSVTASIPFIFLTAKADRQDWRKGMEQGADDYLTKPFTIEELLAAVNTRLKRRDHIINRSKHNLEELRGNIIHSLPHEFNTPLNSILGFSELLTEEYASMDREEIGEFSKYIYRAGSRLHRLIQNFLLYTRIEVLGVKDEDLKELREGYTENSEQIISRATRNSARLVNRESDLKLELSDVPVQMIEANLYKIADELVNNAFKFSKPGTPVHVITTSDEQLLTLQVLDKGQGMTQEQIDKVGAYMQFNRDKFEQQGAGLGLILVKRLVELYEGTLSIESKPTEYTRVCVTLKRH